MSGILLYLGRRPSVMPEGIISAVQGDVRITGCCGPFMLPLAAVWDGTSGVIFCKIYTMLYTISNKL